MGVKVLLANRSADFVRYDLSLSTPGVEILPVRVRTCPVPKQQRKIICRGDPLRTPVLLW